MNSMGAHKSADAASEAPEPLFPQFINNIELFQPLQPSIHSIFFFQAITGLFAAMPPAAPSPFLGLLTPRGC
jgi:hypothetical protein